MLSFKEYLSEMYDFFPKSADEIKNTLSNFPERNVKEIISLLGYINKRVPSLDAPINIDKKKPGIVNVSRKLQGTLELSDIVKGAGLSSVKIKYGNGSSGNRGTNNRGNLFEGEFAIALKSWRAGEEVKDKAMLKVIEDLDRLYGIGKSKKWKVSVEGGENTKRPLQFGAKITLDNPKGSGYNVGKSLTDITLETDKGPIYLSLKLGTTTTFFNVGVRKILSPDQIKKGTITDKNGLALLNLLGVDQARFCKIFEGDMSVAGKERTNSYDKKAMSDLLQSGIGYGYHVVHKLGKDILSKKMDETAMKKAAQVQGSLTVYYGGKTGRGKRVDIEFESPSYSFKLNIRDTQGKDGYPTRLMCDFTTKR